VRGGVRHGVVAVVGMITEAGPAESVQAVAVAIGVVSVGGGVW
jgi:hypothetical protein